MPIKKNKTPALSEASEEVPGVEKEVKPLVETKLAAVSGVTPP